ncbi:PaaI family thioesterase [Phreatobacter sp.]|uniref:PaaI family thioesterase n=1 Tax=Phreatobacter sp. TaxID=1966341 RepID=UPI003F6E8864
MIDQDAFARIVAGFRQSPAIAALGMDAIDIDAAGVVTGSLPLKPEHERATGSGQFHGGPIASFIDTIGDLAVAAAVGGGVPTINLRVDYLKPATGPQLTARATVRRLGRTVAVCDIDVLDARGSLVAIGRGTYGSQTG